MREPLVKVKGYGKFGDPLTGLFVHLPDLVFSVFQRIVRDPEQFGMLTDLPDVAGRGLLAVAESLLNIIGGIAKPFIIVKFHKERTFPGNIIS